MRLVRQSFKAARRRTTTANQPSFAFRSQMLKMTHTAVVTTPSLISKLMTAEPEIGESDGCPSLTPPSGQLLDRGGLGASL